MQKYVKKSEILPVPCQCVFSFMTLIVNNQENIQEYSINTRTEHHLCRPVVSLSCFQKGAFCTGIKIFNILPHSFVSLGNEKAQLYIVFRRSQYVIHISVTLMMNWLFLRMIPNIVYEIFIVFVL